MKRNYKQKIIYTFEENMDVDYNSTIFEVVMGMRITNAIDCIRILKYKYGATLINTAGVMGIGVSTLKMALDHETFDGILKEERLAEAILNLQYFYFQDSFCKVDFEGEVEVN